MYIKRKYEAKGVLMFELQADIKMNLNKLKDGKLRSCMKLYLTFH